MNLKFEFLVKNHPKTLPLVFPSILAGRCTPSTLLEGVKLGRMTSLEGRMTKMDPKIEISAKKYPLTYVKVPPSPLGGDLWRSSVPKWRISVFFFCQIPNGEFQCFFFAVVSSNSLRGGAQSMLREQMCVWGWWGGQAR